MKHRIISFINFFFAIASFTFSQTTYENFWVPNSTVLATARSGNTIYIGGAFTQVGPSTGCGAAINLETGLPDFTFAKVNGVEYGELVSVDDEIPNVLSEFILFQNYPNPFNGTTNIDVHLPEKFIKSIYKTKHLQYS